MNVNELSRLSTLNSTLRKREQGEQIILRSSPNNEDGLNRKLTNIEKIEFDCRFISLTPDSEFKSKLCPNNS